MAKLTNQQIAEEVENLGYEFVEVKEYTNLNSSRIVCRCASKHLLEASLLDLRKPSFKCPLCDKNIDFINPNAVKDKGNCYRVIAFDQATEKFGISVFDDGELVYYRLYNFSGDLNGRLVKIKHMIEDVVIAQWKPDFIVMEDIQYQNGIITFKVLAMLLGVVQTICGDQNIPFEVVSPNVWRKYAGTNGKNRQEEKLLSIAAVKEKYNISVSDDVAEAILIGRYGAMKHKRQVKMAFGQ